MDEFQTLGVKLRRLQDPFESSTRKPEKSRATSIQRGSDYNSCHYTPNRQNLSMQQGYFQAHPDNSRSLAFLVSTACCCGDHGNSSVPIHRKLDHSSSDAHQSNHTRCNHSRDFDQESKAQILDELTSQICQIKEQIIKNEEILQKQKQQISQADEMLQNRNKILTESGRTLETNDFTCTCTTLTETSSDIGQNSLKAEKKKFIEFVKATETRLQQEETALKQALESLRQKEIEVEKKNAALTERAEKLDRAEKEIVLLSTTLEEQNQQLLAQKIDLNRKIEEFEVMYEKFQRERRELMLFEREFNRHRIEAKTERDWLSEPPVGEGVDRTETERRNFESKSIFGEFEKAKRSSEQREESSFR